MDTIVFLAMDDGINMNLVEHVLNELVESEPNQLRIRRRKKRPRNENYFELIIPRYTDIQFSEHFRISRETFELISYRFPVIIAYMLITAIAPLTDPLLNMNVSIEKKMMFTIWTLAKPGSFLAVGDRFGLSKSTGHQIFKNMITILANLLPKYVKWPNDTSRALSEKSFQDKPAICRITNMVNPLLPKNLHIVGDSAYPLLLNLMTPFKDNGSLTCSEVTYNVKLSSIRSIIERAFALLTRKWRRLKYLDISDFQLGNNMIAAACVLHNFILSNDEINIDDVDIIEESDGPTECADLAVTTDTYVEAVAKRRHMVQLVSK
ncbi:uncharacterized protein LOC107272225 [Cephus cinctus]|uniref:Uncharacterized protein LOC107272225 n=1 Tax=Cephus cinctus TaxID=211228 RepID=A0AAJ7FRG2_CEPCN|nr:uncharacterized protein LOC107272225 [Cephus cinctus]